MHTRISIERLNPKKNQNGGFYCLPSLGSFSEITNADEVSAVYVEFETEEEARSLIAKLPKSRKARFIWHGRMVLGKAVYTPGVCFSFEVFHTNKTTGAENESGKKRRLAVLKDLAAMF